MLGFRRGRPRTASQRGFASAGFGVLSLRSGATRGRPAWQSSAAARGRSEPRSAEGSRGARGSARHCWVAEGRAGRGSSSGLPVPPGAGPEDLPRSLPPRLWPSTGSPGQGLCSWAGAPGETWLSGPSKLARSFRSFRWVFCVCVRRRVCQPRRWQRVVQRLVCRRWGYVGSSEARFCRRTWERCSGGALSS